MTSCLRTNSYILKLPCKLFKAFNSPRLHLYKSFIMKFSNLLRDTNLPNPPRKAKQAPSRIRCVKLISLTNPDGNITISYISNQVTFKICKLHILPMVSGNSLEQSFRWRYFKCIKVSTEFGRSFEFIKVNAHNCREF